MIEWYESNEVDEHDQINLIKFRAFISDSGNKLVSSISFDDDMLLRVIRRPKTNFKKSLQILENSLHAKLVTFPQLMKNCYPSLVEHVFSKRIFGALKHRDQQGRKVLWFKLSRWNPAEISEEDLTRAMLVFGWEVLASKVTQLKGVVGIYDASGCTFAHLKVLTPAKLRMHMKLFWVCFVSLLAFLQNCNPFHLGGMHVMHAPFMFTAVLSIFKTLMPRKYRKLLHSHGSNVKALEEHVPSSILPDLFGGQLTEVEATDLNIMENLLQKNDYYKYVAQVGEKEFDKIQNLGVELFI